MDNLLDPAVGSEPPPPDSDRENGCNETICRATIYRRHDRDLPAASLKPLRRDDPQRRGTSPGASDSSPHGQGEVWVEFITRLPESSCLSCHRHNAMPGDSAEPQGRATFRLSPVMPTVYRVRKCCLSSEPGRWLIVCCADCPDPSVHSPKPKMAQVGQQTIA